MLQVQDLYVVYGGVEALRGVSVEVPDGKIVAVLGSNGAGKTTLLRAISGSLTAQKGRVVSGDILLNGSSIKGKDAADIVGMNVVQVPEGRRIFTRLTVDENLRAGGLGNRDKASRAQAYDRVMDLFPIVKERRTQRAGLMSGGEQQMLAIGRALMANPKVLLLDEPSLGLAPRIIGQIGRIVQEINRQGTSVLLVEQNATMALSVSDLAFVLDVGQVSLAGPSEELAASDEVQHLYLGHGSDAEDDAAIHREVTTTTKTLTRWVG